MKSANASLNARIAAALGLFTSTATPVTAQQINDGWVAATAPATIPWELSTHADAKGCCPGA